ncbi:MAG: UvrD-helicase domain-containing protein, partial [Acidobacteriota bacterium]
MIDWGEHLDAQQLDAVQHCGGPAQVIAGPGSGKTRVLTYRIAYLVAEVGLDPKQILAMTFTRKGAREMAERLERLLGVQAKRLWTGTIHSFCYRLLRKNRGRPTVSALVAAWDGCSILNGAAKRRAWEQAVEQAGVPLKAGAAAEIVSGCRNQGVRLEQLKHIAIAEGTTDRRQERWQAATTWEQYQKIERALGSLDFDDLLADAAAMLTADLYLADRLHHLFSAVLVDEAQDLNTVQWSIIRAIAPPPDSDLTVVGDVDQAIYAF